MCTCEASGLCDPCGSPDSMYLGSVMLTIVDLVAFLRPLRGLTNSAHETPGCSRVSPRVNPSARVAGVRRGTQSNPRSSRRIYTSCYPTSCRFRRITKHDSENSGLRVFSPRSRRLCSQGADDGGDGFLGRA